MRLEEFWNRIRKFWIEWTKWNREEQRLYFSMENAQKPKNKKLKSG